jgi:anthranilate synthase/aminodeoxychorismate synthase-like glutamine amidotransferase
MLLLIDNYDSFTFNLYQYLMELGQEVEVHRNDQITVEDCLAMQPDYVVISPGPCTPKEAGISVDLVRRSRDRRRCSASASATSASARPTAAVGPAGEIMHGKTSLISHDEQGVFEGPAQSVRGDSLSFARHPAGQRCRPCSRSPRAPRAA